MFSDTYEFRYNQESQCLVMYPRVACSEEVNQGQTCMALVCLQQTNTTWVSNYKDCPSIQIRTVLRYPQNTKFYNLTSGTNTTCFVNSMSTSSSFVSYTVNNQEKVVWKILSGLSWGLLGVVIAPLLLGCLVLMFRMKIPILKQKFTLKKQQSQMKHQHGEDSKEQEQLTSDPKSSVSTVNGSNTQQEQLCQMKNNKKT
ncbi:hypothetical protein C9374_013809 [Naegleria lovaniensis]|uniref:Uncharacterized protein n=1 Tax=Naegleria lovaniensis TaxID=51637 RepID=A0AA88G5T3_NAELO|nr:uncharacterized protein C9374_013809 [Naegleria lovaniensis]KAG2370853.1 hypothetical protein C9374_013809 [Naegleria lovaniensis]